MKQTRRTGDELLDAISEAILAEIAEQGVQQVTFEGVARRAQTSKPVLYRRFASRAEMIYFPLARQTMARLHASMHDSLRDNLIAILIALRTNADNLGVDNLFALLGEADPALRQKITDSTFSPLLIHWKECITQAVNAGEIPSEVTSPRLLRLPFSCAIPEIVTQGKLSDDAISDIVDNIVLPLYRQQK